MMDAQNRVFTAGEIERAGDDGHSRTRSTPAGPGKKQLADKTAGLAGEEHPCSRHRAIGAFCNYTHISITRLVL